jgi:hypothetical protein
VIHLANTISISLSSLISQNPAAGASVVINSAVDLVVSLGPEMVTVPDVVGVAQADAEAAITAANLTVGSITQEYSLTVPEGDVISQNPIAGTSVVINSAVDLVVSLGCPRVTVPSIVGMTEAEALNAIENAGLVMEITYQITGDPKGYVLSQTPLAGEEVCEGSIVSTVVSLNNLPLSNAGPDQADVPLGTVQLDGGGSTDIDGDLLNCTWTIISKLDGSATELSDPNAVRPTLDIDAYGSYELQLVVNDGTSDNAPDIVIISTHENLPPVADAGEDQPVYGYNQVCLDGNGSYDPNGDDITYSWSIFSKPG